jgi:hypothetical protein
MGNQKKDEMPRRQKENRPRRERKLSLPCARVAFTFSSVDSNEISYPA